MTNEELAKAIQQGRRDLMETLWTQTRLFVRQQARRLWRATGGISGIEVDDLCQSGYFALIAAVDTYDPERGASFIGWLNLSLKTAFADCAGYRTEKRDALNYAGSLDAVFDSADGDGDALGDLIPDPAAEAAFTDAEEKLYQEQLHAALEAAIEKLSPQQAAVVRGYFWSNQTLSEIGAAAGISAARAGQVKRDALLRMARESRKQNSALRQFVEERTLYFNRVSVGQFQRTGTSAVERVVLFRESLAARYCADGESDPAAAL